MWQLMETFFCKGAIVYILGFVGGKFSILTLNSIL